VLKVAGVLRSHPRDQLVFNTFLVGTALSLVFGVAGGLLVVLADRGETGQFSVVLAAPPALTLLLIGVVRGWL
jgi:hypothetical protein